MERTQRVGIIARATNGQRGIGSGYDCEVLRDLRGRLIVCVTEVATQREWMMEQRANNLDGEPRNVQFIADANAANPELSSAYWVTRHQVAEWDALAERWDAARDEAYERRMEGTEEE